MKKNNLLVIVLISIIVLLGGYIVYDKFIQKENKSLNNNEQKNEISNNGTKLYHIEDGEKFNVYGKGEDNQFVDRHKEISFAYPVIDITSDEIKKVNEEIKNSYQSTYQLNLNNEANEYTCIAIKKNNKYYGSAHIFYNKYEIFENDNYLSIVIVNVTGTECASGYSKYTGYVVNKKTNKLMSNKEMLELFGATKDQNVFINKYNDYAETFQYDKISDIEKANILIYDNKLVLAVSGNGTYLLYYENGNLIEH